MTTDVLVALVGALALILTLAAGRLGLASERYRLATTSERLALHYDREGETDQAAKYYTEFVRLASDQSDGSTPRVDAARRRLNEIKNPGG